MTIIDFTVYKGSKDGIVKSVSHRELGRNEAIVQITHSGVCGTDVHVLRSDMALGHEGAGIVKEIGPDVTSVKVGDRVGFGWVHYYCGHCEPCLSGLDAYCESRREYISDDHDEGSFATHVIWDADAFHILPDGLPSEYAGPLMCGGATVWVGIGGLGHLAIQFAAKMGCEVVVFSGTESKREEAMKFGAKEFYATKGLKDLKHVPKINQLLITTSAQPDFSMYIPIMKAGGTIFPLTVSFDASPIPLLGLVTNGLRIQGSAGSPRFEFKKMFRFVVQHDIKPVIMTWPLNKKGIEDAMTTLMEGRMRYRGVLVAE